MYRVAIIQKEIPHYRIKFFDEVCSQAFGQGLDVVVYFADIFTSREPFKFAHTSLPAYQFKRNKNGPFWMKGLTTALAGTDIIVAPHELQCLNVPYLWAKRHKLCKAWIWWGHGYNFQASVRSSAPTYIKEAIKLFMTRRADGLITYTARGAEYWRKKRTAGEPRHSLLQHR